MKRIGIALAWILPTLAACAILACSDLVGFTLQGWLAYSLLMSISLLIIYFIWKFYQQEGAGKALLVAALVALGLRVLVGIVLYRGLPVWGYDEKPQRAGYVFWDSYKRVAIRYGPSSYNCVYKPDGKRPIRGVALP